MTQKYEVDNRRTWSDIIPYAQIAYNTKIHSSTKYSPFEIVFGKKKNKLSNSTNEIDEDNEVNLLKRSLEIEILCVQTQPTPKTSRMHRNNKLKEDIISQKIKKKKFFQTHTRDGY